MAVFYHFDGGRNRIDIGSDADEVDHAVAAVDNVPLKICSADICHDRNLHIGIIFTDDTSEIFFPAKLPRPEIFFRENVPGRFISKLHIINTGLYICPVKVFYKFIGKTEIIY